MGETTEAGGVTYRDTPGFPGYRVGDDGSVWSLWRPSEGQQPWVPGSAWKRLKPSTQASGHLWLCLYRDRKAHRKGVHRLVLEAFVGPCPKGRMARHFPDRDPTNNRIDNLSWGTPKDNAADRAIHGTDGRGERNAAAKLTWAIVREIRSRYVAAKGSRPVAPHGTIRDLSREFHVCKSSVSLIVTNATWVE